MQLDGTLKESIALLRWEIYFAAIIWLHLTFPSRKESLQMLLTFIQQWK